MAAMPKFFTKSCIFKSATYSSLRSRLFSTRNKSKGSVSKRSNGSGESSKRGGASPGNNSYMELQDRNHANDFAAGNTDDDDGRSKKGIYKSVDFNIHVLGSEV